MKKIIVIIATMFIAINSVYANSIETIIKKSTISKNATVSVSIRKLTTGNTLYEKEANKLLNPSSTLKAFTFPVILNELGEEYNFRTQIYKHNKDAYMKLSGDPILTARNMRHLIRALRGVELKQPSKFYIDDTAMDDLEFGIGWQWDDEISTHMPKVSAYNLDGNIYTIAIQPSTDKKSIQIKPPYEYNVAIDNKLKIGTQNKILVRRNFWEGADKITLYGTVATPTEIRIPTYNQKRYFIKAMQTNMNNANVRYYGTFDSKKTPEDAQLVQEYTSPIKPMYSQIMKNSNNMITETLFKTAGAKFTNAQGTTNNGIEAFKNYYKNIGVDVNDIIIVDASGVSRNDLLTTDWMSNALVKINKNDKNFDYKKHFNKPNEGTMVNRLFDLRDFLWAKTGTLANSSGLTGYITTKNGNEYAFAILIQNTNLPISEAKKLEDEIITTLYNKY